MNLNEKKNHWLTHQYVNSLKPEDISDSRNSPIILFAFECLFDLIPWLNAYLPSTLILQINGLRSSSAADIVVVVVVVRGGRV